MASEKQIAANRANALKSTGPKTAAGRSKSGRNAFRHGLSLPVEIDGDVSAKIEALVDGTADNDEIVALVRAVRKHAGPEFTLVLDVGYRWPTAEAALDCIRAMLCHLQQRIFVM